MRKVFVEVDGDQLLETLADGHARRIMLARGSKPSGLHVRASQLGLKLRSKKVTEQLWLVSLGALAGDDSEKVFATPDMANRPGHCTNFGLSNIAHMKRGSWRRFDEDPSAIVASLIKHRWYRVERDGDTWLVFRFATQEEYLLD